MSTLRMYLKRLTVLKETVEETPATEVGEAVPEVKSNI